MTTPPPTADGAPAWLPDVATLNELAGQFFRALPGQPADTGGAVGGGTPAAGGGSVPGDASAPGEASVPGGRPESAPATGLPAAHPYSPASAAGMSSPAGPLPTSAPASYAASAPGPTPEASDLPMAQESYGTPVSAMGGLPGSGP